MHTLSSHNETIFKFAAKFSPIIQQAVEREIYANIQRQKKFMRDELEREKT